MNFNRFFSNSYNLDEIQLKELIKSKKYLVYPINQIELFKSNLNKLIEKGENSALTKTEFNLLQKGISDINQLNFQKVKLNSGTIVAVYLQNISKAIEIPNTEDLPDGTIKEYRGGVYEKVNGEWVPSTEKPEDTNENPNQNITDSNNPDNNINSDQQNVDENQNPEENNEEGGNNPDKGGNDNQGEDGNNKNEDDNDLSGLEELFGDSNEDNNEGNGNSEEQQPGQEQQPNLNQPKEGEEQQQGLPGNNSYKTLEQHAKETPTEELQRFVQNQNNDDDLKQIAMKELTSRGVTLENVESNKILKKIVEKVEKIETKLNGGEEEQVNQNPESPDKLNQATLAEYNKTPGAQKPYSAEGGNKGEEIKVEGLGEEKHTSSVKPEGSIEAANKETEETEEKEEIKKIKETKEGEESEKNEEDKENKNLPSWLKDKDKKEKKEEPEEEKIDKENTKEEKTEEKKEESESKKDEKQVEGEQKKEQEKINKEEEKIDKEKNKK